MLTVDPGRFNSILWAPPKSKHLFFCALCTNGWNRFIIDSSHLEYLSSFAHVALFITDETFRKRITFFLFYDPDCRLHHPEAQSERFLLPSFRYNHIAVLRSSFLPSLYRSSSQYSQHGQPLSLSP